MNQKLIKQLQNGEIAVKNDGTLEELREVLKVAFPEDNQGVIGDNIFYFRYSDIRWDATTGTDLEKVSVKDFFKPDELTLQELIESVKQKAKIEGYNCDVVLEERKGIRVKPIVMAPVPDIASNVYMFSFHISDGYLPDYCDHVKIGEMFEEYINNK